MSSPQPARLLNQAEIPEGFFPTQDLWPLKSEWSVADCHHYTVVDSGADATHPTDGLFGIVRSPGPRSDEAHKTITVPYAGTLQITGAPLGKNVETRAQKGGEIEFKGEHGITGSAPPEGRHGDAGSLTHVMRKSVGLIGWVVVVAVMGCGGSSTSETTVAIDSTPPGNENPATTGDVRQVRHASRRDHHGHVEMSTHPNCDLPGGSEYFLPELNLWRADTAHRTTIVCAGGASSDKPGAGRLLIIRSGAGARESVDQVTVPGVGPVKITKAPLGPYAATRGQAHGSIEFRADDGSTGTLHLKDDKVTLDR